MGPDPVEWETENVPALIDEVLPGRWERSVQQRVWGSKADIDDLHAVLGVQRLVWRPGSLEIITPGVVPPPLKSSVSLSELDMLGDEVDRAELHFAPELEALLRMRAGSSVGGARPKVLLDDDGAWLAKFRRRDDSFNHVRVEHACLLLARRAGLTNTIRSIATFRAPDGFACKARWRRHSCSTSSHLNAAGGFVRRPRRACLSARVDCVVVARCRPGYRLRAAALPHAPRDKLNEAILLIVLVILREAGSFPLRTETCC